MKTKTNDLLTAVKVVNTSTWLRSASAAALLAIAIPAHALYRCVDAKGSISYSMSMCNNPETARELKSSTSGTTAENFINRASGQYARLPDAGGFFDRLRNWGTVNSDATPSRIELSSTTASFEGNDGSKIICHTPRAVLSDDMLMAGEDATALDSRIGKADEDVMPFFAMQCKSIEPKQLEKSVSESNKDLVLPLLLSRINEHALMLTIQGPTQYVQVYERIGAPPATATSTPAAATKKKH